MPSCWTRWLSGTRRMAAETPRMSTTVLPLFPLHSVLFPGGPLSLRIFEPRYVDMVGRCMRESSTFGVVLIRSGTEAGAVLETADIGSSARIVDFTTLPDGLLGITCLGERKFNLVRRWSQDDGLNVGELEYSPPESECRVPEEHRPLQELLRRLLGPLQEVYAGVHPRFEDAGWVGCRLAEILPLTPTARLTLLAVSDPVARLTQLAAWLPR